MFTLSVTATCNAQLQRGRIDTRNIPGLQWHYQPEYNLDQTLDPDSWARQEPGLHVAFGSTDELYLRSEVPGLKEPRQVWNETGWRGERLNAQLLVWSADTVDQVRINVSDLVNPEGKVISRDRISMKMVRYVLSNFPYAAKDFGCDVSSDSVYLMPDRLESFERFDLPGRSVRPVWVAVDIDPSAEPGTYSGVMEIGTAKSSASLDINITVQAQVLPDAADWNYRLDLWQNPWVVAEYYHVEPWSTEHKLLLKKHLEQYAEAGGTCITTYAVHSPWSDNSFSLEGSMIGWVKTRDGSWEFDFSIFDQYVELAMEAGIQKAITVYTPVPWGHRFRYLDETSGNYIQEEWSPDSEKFSDTWNIFLDQLRVHLTDRGWFHKTYLGINENPLEYTLAAARVIKENSADWKITYAGDWHPELSALLDDYSIIVDQTPSREQIRERAARGQTTTFYVCCTPPRPNNFVFSPPVEGRYISWLAAAHGYDGFLRWAYDAWPADPVRDARHTLWPAGDCFLVYPGGNSSIRFEKLREGIVDFEKISILRKRGLNSKDRQVQDLLKDLETHLATFALNPDYDLNEFDSEKMTEALHKGKLLISRLSDAQEMVTLAGPDRTLEQAEALQDEQGIGFQARRMVIDLNGTWEFDRTGEAFPPATFTRIIPVPGLIHLAEPRIDDYDIWFKRPLSVESKEAHGVYDIDYEPKYNWYRKRILIPKNMDGKELLLRIKKSQYVTQVYVNGIDMGTSMECYTPIEIPVTRALRFGRENEILIKVGDRYWLPPQAAGSTDKEKEHYLPGIWDDVELVASGKLQVNNALFLPDAAGGKVNAKIRVRSFYPQQIMYGDPKFDPATILVEVFEEQTGKKAGTGSCIVEARRENFTLAEIEIKIEDPHLWSPNDPFLYKTRTTILVADDTADVKEDLFGLRDFERRGKYFYLNGEKILLRGTNITLQRFFEDPDCSGLAWDREWVKKLLIDDPKHLNWNAMRICVGIVPDFWYDLADKYGMMFQNEWNYWQTHGWDEQVKKEYTNWVWSDGNHPSIVIWDAINENWDSYIGNTLIPELQQLDPTRIWDAGYMTSSQMGSDEMDEPHPYEGLMPWSLTEDFEKDPYPLGDLDYRNQANIASIESGVAQLVNEYGWIWLWRDGRTAKLTNRVYEYYLGDITDPEVNREFQAYWLQCETEWLRSIREHAGVLAFTHLTNNYGYTGDWYINDIKDLEPGPALSWFRHAFAPSAVFINHPDERYMRQFEPHQPGSSILLTLKAINDFNETEYGKVTIRLFDDSGKSVWSQTRNIIIAPYREKNYPVVVDLPGIAGGYTLVTEFEGELNPVEKQVSRRYINVGKRGNQFYEINP